MAGSDSLSEADVKRLLRMSHGQSGCALKERVRQMDHSPQPNTMKHNCEDLCGKCMCPGHVLLAPHVFSFIWTAVTSESASKTHFVYLSCGKT